MKYLYKRKENNDNVLLFLQAMSESGSHGSHDHGSHGNSDSHNIGFQRGLAALCGIYGFFLLERLFTIFTNIRQKKRADKNAKKSSLHSSLKLKV